MLTSGMGVGRKLSGFCKGSRLGEGCSGSGPETLGCSHPAEDLSRPSPSATLAPTAERPSTPRADAAGNRGTHMLTGELRSQVDRIWDAFWSGGISNPMEVILSLIHISEPTRPY